MNRRIFISSIISLLTSKLLLADNSEPIKKSTNKDKFNISINGDLDDDLIIIKSTPKSSKIVEIQQMHNSSGVFKYNGDAYHIKHSPGYIQFNESFNIKDEEIYCICLANEREDAQFPLSKRFRTHYKSEKLLFNKQIFFPPLMPEYNSVPKYPLWFGENEVPVTSNRKDVNGDTYNYYNLFENSVVPFGIVVPKEGNIEILLFNQKNEVMYTYNDKVTTQVKNLKNNLLKKGKFNKHIFTELNNIVHKDSNNQVKNNDYITNVVVIYKGKTINVPLPYPIMYPNLIYSVAVNK